jgi:hypothetical protein
MKTKGEAAEAERVIDFPLEALPSIDEHGILVLAPVQEVWEALLPVLQGSFATPIVERVARGVGCAHTEAKGEVGTIGSTIPGFIVARVIEPAAIALEGRHRYSRYGLIFSLEPTKDEQTLLRAETRADFPGLKGRIYRALVIGTRGHVFVVNRILRAVKRRAERG